MVVLEVVGRVPSTRIAAASAPPRAELPAADGDDRGGSGRFLGGSAAEPTSARPRGASGDARERPPDVPEACVARCCAWGVRGVLDCCGAALSRLSTATVFTYVLSVVVLEEIMAS